MAASKVSDVCLYAPVISCYTLLLDKYRAAQHSFFHSVKANDIQHCTGRVMHFDCLSSNLAPPLRTLLLSGAAGESVMSEEGCRSSEHSVTDFYYLRLFATMLSMPHISRS